MDYIRSCYSTQARFDPSSPTELRPISWYFADESAPLLVGPTPFRSNNYKNLTGDEGELGEVFGQPRPWQRGTRPVPYPPGITCGSGSDFENGITLGGVNPLDPSGVKSCCVPGPGVGTFPPWDGTSFYGVGWTDSGSGSTSGNYDSTGYHWATTIYPPGVTFKPNVPGGYAWVDFTVGGITTRYLGTFLFPSVWSFPVSYPPGGYTLWAGPP